VPVDKRPPSQGILPDELTGCRDGCMMGAQLAKMFPVSPVAVLKPFGLGGCFL
jgi:hypothetical protein